MINILMNNPRVDEKWCRRRLSRYLKPGKKVLVIPFSFHEDHIPDEEAWHECYDPGQPEYEEIVQPMLRMGISQDDICFINYFSDTPKSVGYLIREANIIDLPGGYPDRLISRLWEFGVISQLSSFPGILMGYSAGAMVQMDYFHVTPEEEDQEFYYSNGLDCIDSFDIEVHYTASEVQEECLRRTLEETGRTVIALPEESGLVLERGRLTTFGRVHFFRP